MIDNKLLKLFSSGKILFLENSSCLDDDGEHVTDFLDKHLIAYDICFNVQKIGFNDVLKKCIDADIIIFQTTWSYSVSNELHDYFSKVRLKEYKKTFVELYIHEPTYFRKPDIIHNLYILCPHFKETDSWKFNKLVKNKSYWE